MTTESGGDGDNLSSGVNELSSNAASSLLDLMIQRGYFHKFNKDSEDDGIIIADIQRGDPKKEHQNPPRYYSQYDNACQIVRLQKEENKDSPCCCCTYAALKSKLIHALNDHGGRCSITKVCKELGLSNEQPIEKLLSQCQEEQQVEDHNSLPIIFRVGDDLISHLFLDQKTQQMINELTNSTTGSEEGRLMVSDIAHRIFHLPTEITLQLSSQLQQQQQNQIQLIPLDIGGYAVVTTSYLNQYRDQVQAIVKELTEPIVIQDLCHQHNWDDICTLVATWIQDFCLAQELPGILHTTQNEEQQHSALSLALYEPHCYTQGQRQQVHDWFVAEGYLTATKAIAFGLSKSKMADSVMESFVSCVLVCSRLHLIAEWILTNFSHGLWYYILSGLAFVGGGK